MQKAKIIKEIIGNVIQSEGFSYDKEIKSWGFFKEYHNDKGEISRQSIVFDMSTLYKYKLRMSFNCFSGIYRSYGLNSIIPKCATDGIEYKSEDDFPLVVEKYADILKEYGIKFLKEQENPEYDEQYRQNEYFRQEDYYLLFDKNQSLACTFMSENNIKESQIKPCGIFDLLKNFVLSTRNEPFVKYRNFFVKLAAFYGYILNKTEPCHWKLTDYKTHAICSLEFDSKKIPNLLVTKRIYFTWKKGEKELEDLNINNYIDFRSILE